MKMHSDKLEKAALCRTCEIPSSVQLFKASSRNEKHPEKTLSDMLLELAKVDLSVEHAESLPQQLCGTCTHKLKNAYDFVLQAQQVNQKLLASLLDASKENLDCLLEAPIDITSHEFLQIKMEVDVGSEESTTTGTTRTFLTPSVSVEAAGEAEKDNERTIPKDELTYGDDYNDDDDDDDNWRFSDGSVSRERHLDTKCSSSGEGLDKVNPTVSRRLRKSTRKPPSKRTSDNLKRKIDNGSATDNISDTESVYVPLKPRRRGRPRKSERNANNEGRYVCDVCGKTFAWHKDVQRHAKSHRTEASFVCDSCGKGFQRKDKYMDHMRKHKNGKEMKIKRRTNFSGRLYCTKRFKLLECRLCAVKCSKVNHLIEHLMLHKDAKTLENLEMDNIVIREFFGNGSMKLDDVKEAISDDIAALSLNKYCQVLNQYGYEMSIDDSDEECATEEIKYVCELCGENFTRKYQMLAHAQEKHKDDTMPYRCNVCKLVFACLTIYEQHTKTQCRNRDKKYKCMRCPGKFMWAENLEQHQCADNVKRTKNVDDDKDTSESKMEESELVELELNGAMQRGRESNRYQCCLCNTNFGRLKQLRKHLLLHQDGRTQVDIANGAYFKSYHPTGCVGRESELTMQIATDFATQDYARYYAAISVHGVELDLYDSESSTDNSDDGIDEPGEKSLYICGICGEACQRREHLLSHQESQHSDLHELPNMCEKCRKQFVCAELLEQHQLRDCLNRHKRYQCEKCEERFVWRENLEAHTNIRHNTCSEKPEDKLAKKLKCDLCEKTFIWPKDLTRHKRAHLPNTEKYECPYCERKFLRKDNMQSHIKVHGEEAKRCKPIKVKNVDAHLCKPHGYKRIQCMICHTNHRKIADLRVHLATHRCEVQFSPDGDAVEAIVQALYPDEELNLKEEELIKLIMADVAAEQYERFYSITNEAGYELSLDSTETESDSETEFEHNTLDMKFHKYVCEVCRTPGFQRKYQLYAHQQKQHQWQEAAYSCSLCQARFISAALLEHHSRALCRNAQKRFVCRKCPQRFRWKANFKAHMSSHCDLGIDNGKQQQLATTYDCLECNRSFQMQKDLTRHMFMHSRDSAVFSCQWCPRKFYRRGNLLQHLERHGIAPHEFAYAETLISVHKYSHGKKQIICKVCNMHFALVADLRAHLLNAQTPNPTTGGSKQHYSYDSMLNYSITNQLGYELHLDDSETDDEVKAAGVPVLYTCNLCQLVCRRKHELFRHQQAMHKLEKITLKCPHCVFKSVSQHLLDYHMRTQCDNKQKKCICETCSLKFMWQENLEQHALLHHGDAPTAVDAVAEATSKSKAMEEHKKQVFQCAQCPCKYNRKDRLSAHIKKVHRDDGTAGNAASTRSKTANATPLTAEEQLKKADGKRFLCAFCGKAVSSSSNLIIHMRRHTGEKPFKCDFCEMAFARSSDMQCHRRTHTGERPYQCTVCEKAFSRSYKLHQHMRIHNGERPYKCTYCEKSFTQSNDLTLHIRRHTGERPYVCGICGERFIQGTALKNHRIMRGHFEEATQPARRTLLQQFPVT